jgi:hypothetical protein
MQYNYLVCDGPQCDKKSDLRKPGLNRPDQSNWLTLATGGTDDFHFCSHECLTGFVGDSDAGTQSIDKYASHFGYQAG